MKQLRTMNEQENRHAKARELVAKYLPLFKPISLWEAIRRLHPEYCRMKDREIAKAIQTLTAELEDTQN